MKNRLIAALLSLILLLSCCPVRLTADAAQRDRFSELSEKSVTTGVQALTPEVQRTVVRATDESAELASKKIDKVKSVYDFAGNLYYAVEYRGSGYLICHAESGLTIESSDTAPSPYKGFENALYYCGPTCYYYQDGECFRHTVLDECFCPDDETTLAKATETAQGINARCKAESKSIGKQQSVQFAAQIVDNPTSRHYITGGDKINLLNTTDKIGYYTQDDGCCGYVAAGLLLLWYDKFCKNTSLSRNNVDEVINDFAFIDAKNASYRNGSLTRHLRTLGKESDSVATSGLGGEAIDSILSRYLKERYCLVDTTAKVIPSAKIVCSYMREHDAPLILFGDFYDPKLRNGEVNEHAVLAYGWDDSDHVVVHYGWEGFSNVTYNLRLFSIGGMLCIDKIRSYCPAINDISTSDWAYRAALYCKRYGIIDNRETSFKRTLNTPRSVFVNALYQLAGAPVVSGSAFVEAKFSDFNAATGFHDALVWAYQEGVLSGTSATTLNPSGNLTREQAAVFLQRFSTLLRCSYRDENGPYITAFADYRKVSSFAVQAVTFATKRYLLQGSEGLLNPKGFLTRDQAAQLIYNFTNRAEH